MEEGSARYAQIYGSSNRKLNRIPFEGLFCEQRIRDGTLKGKTAINLFPKTN